MSHHGVSCTLPVSFIVTLLGCLLFLLPAANAEPVSDTGAVEVLVGHAAAAGDASAAAGEDFESDPLESFNEKMFWFNREVLDRFVVKPVATAWDFVLPDPVQRSIHNALDNLAVVRRVVNNLLQAKLGGAGREVARFTINSTIGVVGLFDVAKDGFGIEQSDEDTGQTFGVWGAGPGPYLILPFLPPMTIRDGIGYAFDAAMTPYIYFLPWYANVGINATNVVNERSLNLDRFERVAETTVDLYGAVRNAYLQRRAAAIRQ
ncbi:MAG TPA: VacJ family lipoprotein [candidate division Zixibacteria bacterium]|nr:VacJ family lipoprotein [candidate division Zixibacteria bacterium]